MNKKFVIFDMDGTLIDSMKIWSNLGREYLRARGISGDIEKEMQEIVPLTMREAAELFRERFSLPEDADRIAQEMYGLMEEHYKNDIPLKKGIREYLERLKKAGVRMCVASATAEYLMEACLERLGILSWFDFILSCESIHTSKREPKIYFEAARRLRAVPEETAVYEDVLHAVQTAKKAGFYVVGVYDEESDSQWEQIGKAADEVIRL